MFYESLKLTSEQIAPFLFIDRTKIETDLLTCMELSRKIRSTNGSILLFVKHMLLHLQDLNEIYNQYITAVEYSYSSAAEDNLSSEDEIKEQKHIYDRESRYWSSIWTRFYNLCMFDKYKSIDRIIKDLTSYVRQCGGTLSVKSQDLYLKKKIEQMHTSNYIPKLFI